MSKRPANTQSKIKELEAKIEAEKANAPKPETPSRQYKHKKKITHDLYKLSVAKFTKNIAWQPKMFTPEKVEHCHFFHSVDKNGSAQDKCAPIGGHFHLMELVEEATDTKPAVYKCGPAMKWVLTPKPGGGYKKVPAPIKFPDGSIDDHTHEVEYRDSHDFEPSKLNPEAVKLMNQVEKKPTAPAGIVG